MPPKKRKPAILRLRRRMPPPSRQMRDKSKYTRKDKKKILDQESP
jgi:hypothetical protein